MKTLLVSLLATLGFSAAAAQGSGVGAIVDGTAVAEALRRNALVWDVRPADAFAKGHIPGAVNIGDAPAVLREPNTEDFIATPQIEKWLGSAGLDPAREIIVYGSRGGWQAYFGLYTLQYFGGKSVRVYHDGIDDWSGSGRPVAQGPATLSPMALKLAAEPARVSVSTREVVARLSRPEVQILDVRTVKEFNGEDIRAIRGGHIPGAVNIPYEQNWLDPETGNKLARREVSSNAGMALKSTEALKALYAGLDPNKETIVYCQSGVRAAETATVLADLGFKNVKVYDSSWLGYGNTLDAPANNAVFLNVGALNTRISGMQNRIDALEKELAARPK